MEKPDPVRIRAAGRQRVFQPGGVEGALVVVGAREGPAHQVHRRVVADPERLLPLYREERDALEKAWLADPPEHARAFAEADRLLEEWEQRVARKAGPDTRPGFVRRYWKKRNTRADLLLD